MRSTLVRVLTLAMLCILGTLPAGAHLGGGRVECTGNASIGSTQCTTFTHSAFVVAEEMRPLGEPLKHGIFLPPPSTPLYTGSIESVLEWPAAAPVQRRVFRCTFRNSAQLGACTSTGYPPAPMVSFTHRCYSYIEGSTTPGGSGRFGCYVEHDAGSPVLPAP